MGLPVSRQPRTRPGARFANVFRSSSAARNLACIVILASGLLGRKVDVTEAGRRVLLWAGRLHCSRNSRAFLYASAQSEKVDRSRPAIRSPMISRTLSSVTIASGTWCPYTSCP